MKFEEVLGVLLGWLGRLVSVTVATAGDAPIVVVSPRGHLRAGAELESPGEDSAVYFSLEEDGGTGFILAPQHYAGAGWHESAPDRTLVIRLGAVSLWVELDES